MKKLFLAAMVIFMGALSESAFAQVATDTPTNTATTTGTNTVTATPTKTATYTGTKTPTNTSTRTPTNTLLPTRTPTNTVTATPSFTKTNTPSLTNTPTSTPSSTPTKTVTSTWTPAGYRPGPASENTLYKGLFNPLGTPYAQAGVTIGGGAIQADCYKNNNPGSTPTWVPCSDAPTAGPTPTGLGPASDAALMAIFNSVNRPTATPTNTPGFIDGGTASLLPTTSMTPTAIATAVSGQYHNFRFTFTNSTAVSCHFVLYFGSVQKRFNVAANGGDQYYSWIDPSGNIPVSWSGPNEASSGIDIHYEMTFCNYQSTLLADNMTRFDPAVLAMAVLPERRDELWDGRWGI